MQIPHQGAVDAFRNAAKETLRNAGDQAKEIEREQRKAENDALNSAFIRKLSISQLRERMSCPLSYQLFKDPVTEREGVCSGHTFEKDWIDMWLLIGNENCPLARTHLVARDLIENSEIKRACRLLDPARVEPLDEDDMKIIYIGAEALLERMFPEEAQQSPQYVEEEIHDTIFSKIEILKHNEEFEDDFIRWNPCDFIEWKRIAKIAGFVACVFGFLAFKKYLLGKGGDDQMCGKLI